MILSQVIDVEERFVQESFHELSFRVQVRVVFHAIIGNSSKSEGSGEGIVPDRHRESRVSA
jgi:hypothetical protein